LSLIGLIPPNRDCPDQEWKVNDQIEPDSGRVDPKLERVIDIDQFAELQLRRWNVGNEELKNINFSKVIIFS
jgi:hypothetical protein